MLGACLDRVRKKTPLVHCITNYVTVNDVANMVLACGASPIMADDPREAEEIAALCGGLTLNIGTLNQRTIPAMLAAGRKARSLGRPVVLDPVGAGASSLRTRTALELADQVGPTVIRGNVSEIKALAGRLRDSRGVDASLADAVSEANLDAAVDFVREAAFRLGAVVAVTGAIDLVSDGVRCFLVRNGRPEMGRVTGTGCQLSALTAAFAAASPDSPLDAATAAVAAMGLAGEIAWGRMAPGDGNSTYRSRIIDAVYLMDGGTLERGAKYEIR